MARRLLLLHNTPLLKPGLALAVKLAVTGSILYYLFTLIPFLDVLQAISAALPGYVMIALLIQIAMRYAAALRVKLITDAQGLTLSTWHIFKIFLVTNFYGLFLPGTISAGAVTLYKYYRQGAEPAKALTAIVFSRLVEAWVVLITGICFWFLDPRRWSNGRIALFLLLVLCGLSLCYLLFFTRSIASALFERATRAVTYSRLRALRQQSPRLKRIQEAVQALHNLPYKALTSILLTSLVHVFLGALSAYLLAISLKLDLSFFTVAWIRSLVYIITLLPISFSGLGVREAALVLLLQFYGISSAAAMAWSFLLLAGTLFVGCIGAMIEARLLHSVLRN